MPSESAGKASRAVKDAVIHIGLAACNQQQHVCGLDPAKGQLSHVPTMSQDVKQTVLNSTVCAVLAYQHDSVKPFVHSLIGVLSCDRVAKVLFRSFAKVEQSAEVRDITLQADHLAAWTTTNKTELQCRGNKTTQGKCKSAQPLSATTWSIALLQFCRQ